MNSACPDIFRLSVDPQHMLTFIGHLKLGHTINMEMIPVNGGGTRRGRVVAAHPETRELSVLLDEEGSNA